MVRSKEDFIDDTEYWGLESINFILNFDKVAVCEERTSDLEYF